jgi:hypothetical protein
MSKSTRWLTGAVVGAAALIAFSAGVVGAKPKPRGKKDTGTVYANLTHTSGSTEYIAADVRDKLLGSGAATFRAKVGVGSKPGTLTATVKPVTVFFKNGSLTGTATVTFTTNPDLSVTVVGGKLVANKGAGGEKRHSLIATFTGSGKTLTGPYVFNYKGRYR